MDRYRAVIDAYLAGLERARGNGRDLSAIHSVASFFVSRANTEVDARLDTIGSDEAASLKGRAAVANARLAYQVYEATIADDRWQALAVAGARSQRPLWASTGVKDPSYPDTMYIADLVAPHTVTIMPRATLDAFADHGELTTVAIAATHADTQRVFDDLGNIGVDIDDATDTPERQGSTKCEKS